MNFEFFTELTGPIISAGMYAHYHSADMGGYTRFFMEIYKNSEYDRSRQYMVLYSDEEAGMLHLFYKDGWMPPIYASMEHPYSRNSVISVRLADPKCIEELSRIVTR